MTERRVIYHPCPECGQTMETIDEQNEQRYVSACKHCGWHDIRLYSEVEKQKIEII